MRLPFTRQTLLEWAGSQVFGDAVHILGRGSVRHAEYDPPMVTGLVEWGTRRIRASVRIDSDGSAENHCPCHDSRDRGIICAHVVALGLALLDQAFDPRRKERERIERRRAERQAQIKESAYISRAAPRSPGAVSAKLRLILNADWPRQVAAGRISVLCDVLVGDSNGSGAAVPLDSLPRSTSYRFPPADEALLYVWEDISNGPAGARLCVSISDFVNLLDLRRGGFVVDEAQPGPIEVHAAKASTRLQLNLDPGTGELVADLVLDGTEEDGNIRPVYLVEGRRGWVYARGAFRPLSSVLPEPLHGLYRGSVRIPREGVPQFIRGELPHLMNALTVDTDLSEDSFILEPDTPCFRLMVRGSPAALSASAYADYGTFQFVLGKETPGGHFTRPEPSDIFRYHIRNLERERRGLRLLREVGFGGAAGDDLSSMVGTRPVHNFLGKDLPALRRSGWRVELEGRIAEAFDSLRFVTPVVRVDEQPGMGWFDVCLDYEDAQGNSIPSSEIQRAFLKGDAFLDRGETIFLLDSEAIASMQEVFEDCAAGEGRAAGSFRLPGVYAPYVKSSLDSIDGIDVEANAGWLQRADRQNKLATADPMPIPDSVTAVLRPYQIAGVHWLGFLDRHAFGGILADEMGLGKTLQTLTWLQSRRQQENGNRSPALIVCPTSLVENWAEEAARFTPHQDVLVISGAKRDTAFHRLCEADLVITSYALLRRDLERYAPFSFSAMVLDEAQHIKNHSTRNAKAAKAVRAERRLVLTGTPIENSVSDLWSIMDFLMPGYLGDHPSFRDRYEVPIARGDRQSESALARLRRKLNPFLLRRLKRDVARELPPKIERVARFHLSPDQQQVYQEVLRESQHRLTDLVARRGFQRSRMQILSTLLRLRQICCHVDLLKIPGLNVERPSAKLELFFELLDEALDGGHRMLVFSQFVSMLTILREQLEQRGVAYSYLDGGTTQRQNEVNRFNRQADIPVFLISLKAGGTGLNLTGADMVVHFDPWWNPAVEAQATDRAYRIGQLRTVYSLKLIARNSVEEEVLALQAKKRAVIDAALSSDQAFLEQLDWDDIRTLLNM